MTEEKTIMDSHGNITITRKKNKQVTNWWLKVKSGVLKIYFINWNN